MQQLRIGFIISKASGFIYRQTGNFGRFWLCLHKFREKWNVLWFWISQLVTLLLPWINWHISLFCVLNTPKNISPWKVSEVILPFGGNFGQLLNRSKLHSIAYVLDQTLLINVIIVIDIELLSCAAFCSTFYPSEVTL